MPPASLEMINQFNNINHIVTVQLINDGLNGDQVVLRRYLIGDHGISFGSFRANLAALETGVQVWNDFLKSNP